jgi:uncharacterized protein YndB with AHSA1/START domain
MPQYSVSIDIHASAEAVFAAVSDMTKHPQWAADPLKITAASAGPVTVGSIYTSSVVAQGKNIETTLTVTRLEPPNRFAFSLDDLTGHYEHEFIITPQSNSTRLERRVKATLTLPQTILFWLVYPIIKRPNTVKALNNLKTQLDQQ